MTGLKATLLEALALKDLPRAGWVRAGVDQPESVAAHSWGVAWLVLVLCPEGVDRGRALAIAVAHDLAEVRCGDITPHDGVPAAEKQAREQTAMEALAADLPNGDEILALWREYEDGDTAEGRFVKACDKLDMALQAQSYSAAQGLDLEEFVESALGRLGEGVLKELATPAAT